MTRYVTHRAARLLTIATAGALPAAASAQSELAEAPIERQSVEQEVAELRSRVAQLEAGQTSAVRLEEGQAGVVRTASGIDLIFGGYVKADFIYDVDQALGDTFVASDIDVDEDGEPRFRAHARQTRFNLGTTSDTSAGPLTTFIEVDFFGSGGNEIFSNSSTLRIRHAYVEWNGLLAGQTWSNFMPIESYPSTIDFEGPAGIPFIRQAQLRYTLPVSERLSISASIENSEFSGRDANGTFSESTNAGIRAGLDEAPDFTLAAIYEDDWGLVKAAALGRVLGSPTSDDTATGWGLSLSGLANLWEGGGVNASISGGDGIGRYLINGFGQDAFVDSDGDVDAITSYGATLGVIHDFTPTISGGLVGGWYEVDDTFSPDDVETLKTVHTTLIWNPVERLTIGGEVIWGERENADGRSGDNVRLQGAIQVTF